jgi:hypothetical protein
VVVPHRARELLVAALAALVLVPAAAASGSQPNLSAKQATAIFLRDDKVVDWLGRYPRKGRTTDASYNKEFHLWTIKVWWGAAGEIATGRVDDRTGRVTEAWTGPQVAWTMARGGSGAFGGKVLNNTWVWLGLCAVFLLGLGNLRRPLSLRNLDLLVLLAFSASLWYFNKGDVFTAVPIVYPLLLYLVARSVSIAFRRGRSPHRPVWPMWVLAAATIFLIGFRIGLNVEAPNSVIDVGYSGVIGAERIVHGEAPYGHMPVEDLRKPCGPADLDGEIRDRIQTNGRCESADPQGDTYGPASYEAYIPAYGVFGWSGKWDSLPAAHATAILFDLLCILGLALVGRRFGGLRLAATLAFAWAAYPFTAYVLNSNTNDAIMPCILVYGFWLISSPWARGAACALATWTKFAAAVVAPLWLSYPDWRKRRPQERFLLAFVLVTLAVFSILLLEPNPIHAARVFWDRTIWWQLNRSSPFSLWDWRQYHAAGIPNLHAGQYVCESLLLLGAVAAYFLPRRKSPLQLAALTAALLLGFELCLTHWFYLYIPWFFPFTAIALLVPPAGVAVPAAEEEAAREHGAREALVPAG